MSSKLSVRNFKVIIIFAMLLICMLGILPYRMVSLRKSGRPLSYLNCFSAGMFLTIGFVHMFPESVEQYEHWNKENKKEGAFPLPYALMFAGYVLILFVDRVIMHKLVDHGHHHHNTQEEVQCQIQPEASIKVEEGQAI